MRASNRRYQSALTLRWRDQSEVTAGFLAHFVADPNFVQIVSHTTRFVVELSNDATNSRILYPNLCAYSKSLLVIHDHYLAVKVDEREARNQEDVA